MSEDDDLSYEEEEEELESDSGSEDLDSRDSRVASGAKDAPMKPHKDVKRGAKADNERSEINEESYGDPNVDEESKEQPDLSKKVRNEFPVKHQSSKNEDKSPKQIQNSSVKKSAEVGEMEEAQSRVFQINEENIGYPKNYITTTKYNLITFLPFSLLKQFFRIANIYFLIIAILSSIPSISSISPATAIMPLVFVLLVSMVREGIEDFYRYKADKASNAKKIQRLNEENEFVSVCSKDLEVGDIVLIHGDDTFAADIILLKSSNGSKAFIQTSSLDGEKNLKKRYTPKGLEEYLKPIEEQSYLLGGTCTTSLPNKSLEQFRGKLQIGETTYPLTCAQLMFKDAKLKNTSWIIGTVAYTGTETKVMLNSMKSRIKVSNLEKRLNRVIIFLFCIQILICIILCIITAIYDDVKDDNQDYYLGSGNSNENAFLNFFSYFLLLSTLIPISLIVTLEVVKVIQCYYISQDAQMYDLDADAGTKVSSTTINEELGQVTYVFSDKTGTLTQNIMEFRALCVGQQTYGDLGGSGLTRKLTNVERKKEVESNFESKKLDRLLEEKANKSEQPFVIHSTNGKSSIEFKSEKDRVQEVIKLLAICHDCETEMGKVDGKELKFYQGASPDEITLVDFARDQGFEFDDADDKNVNITLMSKSGMIKGKSEKRAYAIHKKVPFSSARARMSLLFTDPDDGKTKLFIKGADTKIKERLSKKQNSAEVLEYTETFLDKAAVTGLRTLLLGMKVIDKDELKQIQDAIRAAENDVSNTEMLLDKVYEDFEKDCVLIGATCVEDKLQEDVPDTLEDFRRAGIKVWMLTGDKLETAKNIGFSCKLLVDEMIIFQAEGAEEAKNTFTEAKVEDNEQLIMEMKPRAIVLDSNALSFVMTNPEYLQHFLSIALTCNAVVLSRASPSQKAEVVKLIKKNDKTNITLSIGDGANDVPMISVADIGIGIYGKEGVNAAQAADFAIHKFKYVWNLVLYHGRFNYMRNSELILYFFYKNVVFTIPQVYFAFISDFSAQTIFDDWYISFYNLFFTSLPIVYRTIFETDVDYQIFNGEKREIIKNFTPRLYYIGNKKTIFTYTNYFIWIMIALVHSLIIFLFTHFTFKTTILAKDGKSAGLWSFSVTLFFSIIIAVTIRLCVTQRLFNVFNIVSIILLSLLLYYAYNWFSNYFNYSKTYLTSEQLHESPIFYLTVFLCAGFIFICDLFYETVLINLMSSPASYMRRVVNQRGDLPTHFEQEYERLMLKKAKKELK